MNVTDGLGGGSAYNAAEEKKKKKQQILDDKNLNIWQKKHLLEQMEGETKPRTPENSTGLARLDNTKAQDKPRFAPVKNPFTYLNKPDNDSNPPESKKETSPSPAPQPDRRQWLMDRGVPLQAAEAILRPAEPEEEQEAVPKPTKAPEEKPGSTEWLMSRGVPLQAAEAIRGSGSTPQPDTVSNKATPPRKNKAWIEEPVLNSRPGYDLPLTIKEPSTLSPMYRGPVPTKNMSSPGLWASGSYDPIEKAAAAEAREFLDKEVSKYSYATLTNGIKTDLENKLARDKFLNDGLFLADLGLSVYNGFKDASAETTQLTKEWLLDGGLRTLVNVFGDEPSLSDYKIDTMGNEVEKGDKKISFINSTDYQYFLIDGDDIAHRNGAKQKFVRNLKDRVGEIDGLMPDYGSKSENEQYKKAYLNYLNRIIDMNERSDRAALDREFDKIDRMYK